MIERLLPFLNQVLPAAIAVKGMSTVNPKLGRFLTTALSSGYAANELLDVLRNHLEPRNTSDPNLQPHERAAQESTRQSNVGANYLKGLSSIGTGGLAGLASLGLGDENQQENVPSQQSSNPLELISGYSPDLTQFISEQIQKGQSPKAAAAIAKNSSAFSKIIQQIEKDTRKNFVDLLEEMLAGQSFQRPQSTGTLTSKMTPDPRMAELFASPTGGQMAGAQGPSSVNPRLASALQNAKGILGKR